MVSPRGQHYEDPPACDGRFCRYPSTPVLLLLPPPRQNCVLNTSGLGSQGMFSSTNVLISCFCWTGFSRPHRAKTGPTNGLSMLHQPSSFSPFVFTAGISLNDLQACGWRRIRGVRQVLSRRWRTIGRYGNYVLEYLFFKELRLQRPVTSRPVSTVVCRYCRTFPRWFAVAVDGGAGHIRYSMFCFA